MLDRYRDALATETCEEVLVQCHNIERLLEDKFNPAELDSWQLFAPFEAEYLAMYMLRSCEASRREEALAFYLRYADLVKHVSDEQKMHTRLFFIQLLQTLPEEQRGPWLQKVSNNW